MPKRKLSDLNGSEKADKGKGNTRKMSMKAVRVTNKFDFSVQLIIKALKTARGFERQKLSRREKAARSPYDSTTLERLGEEIQALKVCHVTLLCLQCLMLIHDLQKLNYEATSERYLFKQLTKTKRIAESPIFQEFLLEKNISIEGPKSTAEANILARLCKSTPMQKIMPSMLDEFRKLLGIEDMPAGKQEKGAKKDVPKKETAEKASRKQKEVSISGSESEEEDAPDGDMDISDEDFAAFDSRLAPGSDEESESDDEDEDDGRAADDISDSVSRSPDSEFSGEESEEEEEEEDESEEESEEDEEASPPPKKTKGSKGDPTPAQATTFLPSLMMGGYWSGSEEEATDDEKAAAAPKRKNRMGQQARRALWEKKYGDKANHVKAEQQQQKRNRDHGWDTKRGATGSGGRGGRGGAGVSGRPPNRQERRAGGLGGPPPKPHKDNEGPLHPSWEAKKKQKEQPAVAFQGKKVTFD